MDNFDGMKIKTPSVPSDGTEGVGCVDGFVINIMDVISPAKLAVKNDTQVLKFISVLDRIVIDLNWDVFLQNPSFDEKNAFCFGEITVEFIIIEPVVKSVENVISLVTNKIPVFGRNN